MLASHNLCNLDVICVQTCKNFSKSFFIRDVNLNNEGFFFPPRLGKLCKVKHKKAC